MKHAEQPKTHQSLPKDVEKNPQKEKTTQKVGVEKDLSNLSQFPGEEKTLQMEKIPREVGAGKDPSKVPKSHDEVIKELTETIQRLQAEFENYRKRTEKEQQTFTAYATQGVFMDILPIVDHFTLALENTGNHDEFVKGIELIYSQCIELLKNNGINKIDAKGKKFDPTLHEALLQEKSDQPSNTVIEELQSGYTMAGKILRPTKVKVAK